MKLWVISDLHRDHGKSRISPPDDADVAVIAGDVCDMDYLKEVANFLPVVFVLGNHEFYKSDIFRTLHRYRGQGFHIFENEANTIGDAVFVGATLWTDYRLNEPEVPRSVAMETARGHMNDHRYINYTHEPWQRFTPRHAASLHAKSRDQLRQTLITNKYRKTVVVTHHAPHPKSIHPKYEKYRELNGAYASNLEDLILETEPTLWVHGHVHSNHDYIVGKTRVLCNPHGYPGENSEFNPNLIVKI